MEHSHVFKVLRKVNRTLAHMRRRHLIIVIVFIKCHSNIYTHTHTYSIDMTLKIETGSNRADVRFYLFISLDFIYQRRNLRRVIRIERD